MYNSIENVLNNKQSNWSYIVPLIANISTKQQQEEYMKKLRDQQLPKKMY